jgi:transposase
MHSPEQNCALTARQERVLAAILQTPSVESAAKRAGVSRGTIYNWMGNPTFKAALSRRQAELFGAALGQLKMATAAAVKRLADLVAAKDDRLALMAAREILGTALRAHEAVDVEQRLADIEQRLNAAEGAGT